MKRSSILLWFLLVAGCGGTDESASEELSTNTSGSDSARERDDGVTISGLMGTIRRDQVENALNPRMPRFMRCFSERMGEVEYLAGNIRLSFRIHTDGTVAWVYPAESDLGDRAAEQCALGVASSTRFPRPRGGEAEFTWGFGFDASEDTRPPLNWQQDSLGASIAEIREVARRCRASEPFAITAYIAPGGGVLAAGGSMPSHASSATLDCILQGLRMMTLPDPGSYAAKVTFSVP